MHITALFCRKYSIFSLLYLNFQEDMSCLNSLCILVCLLDESGSVLSIFTVSVLYLDYRSIFTVYLITVIVRVQTSSIKPLIGLET